MQIFSVRIAGVCRPFKMIKKQDKRKHIWVELPRKLMGKLVEQFTHSGQEFLLVLFLL